MSELLSVNKPQEMTASVVNEEIDDSWFKTADNLLIEDDVTLDYKLTSAEDVEFFNLLEADSLKYTEKISGQQEEEKQQPQQGNETFLRDFKGDVSEQVEETKMLQEQIDTETKLSEVPVYKFDKNDTGLLPEEIETHTVDENDTGLLSEEIETHTVDENDTGPLPEEIETHTVDENDTVNESFNDDVIVLEDDELIDNDNIDDG
ncbi:30295_t:CDS:1, partial [Racocetra persica]